MMYRFLLLIVVGSFALGSCGESKTYEGPSGEETGKIIYEKKCFICHGEYGDEGNSGAANLRTSILKEEDMKDAVKHGRGDMQPVSDLNEDQVNLVIDYVRNELKKKVKK